MQITSEWSRWPRAWRTSSRDSIEENQIVKKGDLLARSTDADYAARVRQAEASWSVGGEASSADAQVQVVRASHVAGSQREAAVSSRQSE